MILQAGYTQLRSINLFISYHTQMITTRLAINMLTTFYKTHTESLLARQARVRRRRGSSCSSPEHSCSCAIFWHPVFSLRCYTCPCRCFSLPCPVCNFSFLISHENLFRTFWEIWCFPPNSAISLEVCTMVTQLGSISNGPGILRAQMPESHSTFSALRWPWHRR